MTASNNPPPLPRPLPVNAAGFTVGILILVAALLAWYSHTRIEDYRASQHRLTQANVEATAMEVSFYLQNLRNNVSLFAQDRAKLIDDLAINPDDLSAYRQLQAAINAHFPHHFAFTVTNDDGMLLLQAMDHLIDKGCRRDIRPEAYAEHVLFQYLHRLLQRLTQRGVGTHPAGNYQHARHSGRIPLQRNRQPRRQSSQIRRSAGTQARAVRDYVRDQRAKHFDPALTDLLLDNLDEFSAIAAAHQDAPPANPVKSAID